MIERHELNSTPFKLPDLPFTLVLNHQNPLKPSITISIDLKEYLFSFLTYHQNRSDPLAHEHYTHQRAAFRNQFLEFKGAFYFEMLIDQLFTNDPAARESVKDTFAYHYVSRYFLEIWCNTMDEVLQMHGLSNHYESVIAVLDIIVEHRTERNDISIALIDRSGRGFPIDFLMKMNAPLQRKEHLLTTGRSHKKYDRFAFLHLTPEHIQQLKDLLPEHELPSGIKIQEICLDNYKNMLFTSTQFDLLINALQSLSPSSEQQIILIQLSKPGNTNEINFGGRGLGFRLMEWLIDFNATFDPVKKIIKPNKYLLDRSSLQVFNIRSHRADFLDAVIVVTTSTQSYRHAIEDSIGLKTPEAKSIESLIRNFDRKFHLLDPDKTTLTADMVSPTTNVTYDPFEMSSSNQNIDESIQQLLTQNTTPDNTAYPTPSTGTPVVSLPAVLDASPSMTHECSPSVRPRISIFKHTDPAYNSPRVIGNHVLAQHSKEQKTNHGLSLMNPSQWLDLSVQLPHTPLAPFSRLFPESNENRTRENNTDTQKDIAMGNNSLERK